MLTFEKPNHKTYFKFKKYVDYYERHHEDLLEFYKPQRDHFDEYLSKNTTETYWIFDHEKNLIGIIRYRENDTSYWGNIGLDIHPLFRNKGYSKLILQLLFKILKDRSVEKVTFTISKTNIAAQKVILNMNGNFLKEVYHKNLKKYVNEYQIIL